MSKTQQPSIDYASLISLSNSSRVDAIKTMDELSHRLSKSSRSSLGGKKKASPSSPSSTSSSSKSKPSQKDKSSKKMAGDKGKGGKTKSPPDHRQGKKAGKAARNPSETPSHDASPKHVLHKTERTKPTGKDHVGELRNPTVSPRLPRRTAETTKAPKRISYLSMSSGSTKLGEIPIRRSRLVWNPDDEDFEYGYRPVYPLHAASKPVTEERAGFFKRLFGTKEKSTSR
ncbi:hypothetical protein SLS62_011388 [Diatrype stigma]|uniref:Uncharacterized protein n=1 Tax=Diatrype stigma TaxID=117547 RepID=A0AAN9YF37_9PEZI